MIHFEYSSSEIHYKNGRLMLLGHSPEYEFEAWERMTCGGVQIEWYSHEEYETWRKDAEAWLASCGF